MQELRLQPYHDLRGAIFRPEAGWSIPAGYGSLDAEVRAVRTRAGMIDLSDRAKIELTGSERVPFLDGLVTTDLKIFGPGMSTYALLLNEKSRVLGDLRVYAFADSLVLDIDPAQKDSICVSSRKPVSATTSSSAISGCAATSRCTVPRPENRWRLSSAPTSAA